MVSSSEIIEKKYGKKKKKTVDSILFFSHNVFNSLLSKFGKHRVRKRILYYLKLSKALLPKNSLHLPKMKNVLVSTENFLLLFNDLRINPLADKIPLADQDQTAQTAQCDLGCTLSDKEMFPPLDNAFDKSNLELLISV